MLKHIFLIRINPIQLSGIYTAPELCAKWEREMHHHFPNWEDFSWKNYQYSYFMYFWVSRWIWYHWRINDSFCFSSWTSVSKEQVKYDSCPLYENELSTKHLHLNYGSFVIREKRTLKWLKNMTHKLDIFYLFICFKYC